MDLLPLAFFPIMLLLYGATFIVKAHADVPVLLKDRPRCILDRYLKMHGL
jgi:hypothetical protein